MNPEYKKKLAEFEEAERGRRAASAEYTYDPSGMRTGRMPLGCLLLILVALCGAAYLVGKMFE